MKRFAGSKIKLADPLTTSRAAVERRERDFISLPRVALTIEKPSRWRPWARREWNRRIGSQSVSVTVYGDTRELAEQDLINRAKD